MKLFLYIFISFLCCCNIANDKVVDNGDIVKNSSIGVNSLHNSDDFIVEGYEDDKLVFRNYYENGLQIKSITYNTQTNSEEFIYESSYKKNGELERVEKVKKGENYKYILYYYKDRVVKSVTHNLETNKDEKIMQYYYSKNGLFDYGESILGENISDLERPTLADIKWQFNFLSSKNIKLPFPGEDLLFSETSDIMTMMSIAEHHSDFKKEIKTDKKKKIIKFIGFNKNPHFYPSSITFFIHENEFVTDYELTLINDFPSKEIYQTKKGKLTREYFYADNRIMKVLNTFVEGRNKISSERRFEYHSLDEK